MTGRMLRKSRVSASAIHGMSNPSASAKLAGGPALRRRPNIGALTEQRPSSLPAWTCVGGMFRPPYFATGTVSFPPGKAFTFSKPVTSIFQ
jgi:hypothetical protein